ncbi:MAG TPA: ABC transporter substrate-binding protein [Paenibacillus sp.]|uniref:ABC transporter substrate-binding protein n=1 Tax=Paenibacillus TaxID=44249 RepID=UPI000B9FCF3A|nr:MULTISPECIES: ABC transporter substrate-binding protein [Paenibacillus]OZQ61617.1 ABC transporter substrate-binding protein [Paenibacillus taichungensis]HBU82477.1 ABC transporter substrate-binding protein [Paenibacillus sp.]
MIKARENVMKKSIILLTLVALAVSLTACGGKKTSENLPDSKIEVAKDTPSWKNDKAKADLDWYINFDWFAQVWGNDVSSKYITEDTGVNITYLGGSDDKLNTMMASGDLPDIITMDGSNPFVKEADKFAIPLDVLAEKYDPYFMEKAAKPETLKYFTRDDGHIYGYPNFSNTSSDYEKGGVYGNQAFLVRKDMYEQLGKPDMTTPEGFTSALDAAQKLAMKDELGKSIIPIGVTPFTGDSSEKNGVFNRTLADFIGVPILTEDSKYYDRYTDADFQKWLKVFVDARQKGLADRDMTTMTKDDKDARLTNGSYFAYFAADLNSETDTMTVWANEHPGKEYIAVNGPISTTGKKTALPGTSIEGWTQTFITKDAKDPQKAMELLTYLVSEEGNNVMNFGREGENYTIKDGNPVLNADLLEFKQTDPAGFEKKVGLTTHLWLQDSALLSRQMGISQFPKALQQAKQWTQDYVVPQFELASLDVYLSKESSRNKEKIDQNWSQTIAKILDAKSESEVDQAMAEFIQYRMDNGFDELVKERNSQIEANVKKLK